MAGHYNDNMGYGLELGQVVPLLVRVIVVVGMIVVVCVTVSVGVFAAIGILVAAGVLLLLLMSEHLVVSTRGSRRRVLVAADVRI